MTRYNMLNVRGVILQLCSSINHFPLFPYTDRTVAVEPSTDQFLISPITGEKIPADKVPQHMRIGK